MLAEGMADEIHQTSSLSFSGRAKTWMGIAGKDLEILPRKSLDLPPRVVRIYATMQLHRAFAGVENAGRGVKALGVNWSVHSLCKRYRFGGFYLPSPVCLISTPTFFPDQREPHPLMAHS
jgi:hypothetical protein